MTHSTSPTSSEQRAAAVRLVDANALVAALGKCARWDIVAHDDYEHASMEHMRRSTDGDHIEFDDVRKCIDAAPSIVPPETPEGRWIDVKERLPDNHAEVDVLFGSGETRESLYVNHPVHGAQWYQGNDTFDEHGDPITHWTPKVRPPLPAPVATPTPHAELIRQLDAANTEGEVVKLATRELHMAAIENEDVRAAFDRARERANRAGEAAKKAKVDGE